MIDLDLAELGALKTTRALTDPVIVHEPTQKWAPPKAHDIYDHVTMARLRQNLDTPLEERIRYATWPETVAYLYTASMDGRYANREFEQAYRYNLRSYLDRWTPLDPDQQPDPLCNALGLDDYRREQLDTLRFGIKKDRDTYFVEHRYDDLDVEGVPTSFWLSSYEIRHDTDDRDDMAQSALQEFLDDR